jgi:ribosomal protein S18 acetylase RimI-like enzyme
MLEETIRTRIAGPGDNIHLAELGRRTFYDSFARDNTPEDMAAYLAASFSPEKQAAELADPQTSFLIAEVDGGAVGYARLRLGEPPAAITGRRTVEIVRFYSVIDWIGRGVGAALMSACFRLAGEMGCDTIWLDVWEQNPRAIAFYLKWGFTVVGEQTFQLGSDLQHDLLMQRSASGESDE